MTLLTSSISVGACCRRVFLTLIQNRDAMPSSVPASVLANRWVARDDARNYVVLGDPAARLKIGGAPATAPGSVPASFGITAPAPADVTAESPVAFDTHIDAKPALTFRDFSGPIRNEGRRLPGLRLPTRARRARPGRAGTRPLTSTSTASRPRT